MLADFEDASTNIDDADSKRELMLVADALRLGGAILAIYPNMLASQLIGRVITFYLISLVPFKYLVDFVAAIARNRWKSEYPHAFEGMR